MDVMSVDSFDKIEIEKASNGFIVNFLKEGKSFKKMVFFYWDTLLVGLGKENKFMDEPLQTDETHITEVIK